jgi:hypothetical protein
MSPDPYSGSYDMNNPQSFNRYSYVLNNPLSFTDRSGLNGDPDPDPCGEDPSGKPGGNLGTGNLETWGQETWGKPGDRRNVF